MKLRISDRLLLVLALIMEGLDEIVGGGSRAYHYGKLFIYTPENYERKYLKAALKRIAKNGSLKFGKDQNRLQLTKLGWDKLREKFPLIKFQNKRWDGLWRLVVFDISEKDRRLRSMLRRNLVKTGFGQLQKSMYISPHDVAEKIYQFLNTHGLENEVYVLTSRQLYIKDFGQLARKIWPVDKLNRRYKLLMRRKNNHRAWLTDYLDIVVDDPFLPKDLLPKPWYGFKARLTWNQIAKRQHG